jgi:hypothetical protein
MIITGCIIATCILAGCAGHDTGTILPIGPDTYRLSERRGKLFGGSRAAQEAALTRANSYCSSNGKNFMPVSTDTEGETEFQVDFRCLRAGDPDLHRPNLVRSPDISVQVN